MKVKIEFEVYKDEEADNLIYPDLYRIINVLDMLSLRMQMTKDMPTKVLDVNGNSIGQIEVEE